MKIPLHLRVLVFCALACCRRQSCGETDDVAATIDKPLDAKIARRTVHQQATGCECNGTNCGGDDFSRHHEAQCSLDVGGKTTKLRRCCLPPGTSKGAKESEECTMALAADAGGALIFYRAFGAWSVVYRSPGDRAFEDPDSLWHGAAPPDFGKVLPLEQRLPALLVASLNGDDRAATSEIVAELLSRDENAVVDAFVLALDRMRKDDDSFCRDTSWSKSVRDLRESTRAKVAARVAPFAFDEEAPRSRQLAGARLAELASSRWQKEAAGRVERLVAKGPSKVDVVDSAVLGAFSLHAPSEAGVAACRLVARDDLPPRTRAVAYRAIAEAKTPCSAIAPRLASERCSSKWAADPALVDAGGSPYDDGGLVHAPVLDEVCYLDSDPSRYFLAAAEAQIGLDLAPLAMRRRRASAYRQATNGSCASTAKLGDICACAPVDLCNAPSTATEAESDTCHVVFDDAAATAHGTKAERKAPGAPVKVLAPPAR